jgi:uncharacterized protein (UPF0335 family)
MAVAVSQFEVEELVQEQERIARLEERTEHMQSDITEIKADVRRLDAKVDAVKDSLTALRLELKEGFAAIEAKFAKAKGDRAFDRVWHLLTSAALLGVMARGFHWI